VRPPPLLSEKSRLGFTGPAILMRNEGRICPLPPRHCFVPIVFVPYSSTRWQWAMKSSEGSSRRPCQDPFFCFPGSECTAPSTPGLFGSLRTIITVVPPRPPPHPSGGREMPPAARPLLRRRYLSPAKGVVGPPRRPPCRTREFPLGPVFGAGFLSCSRDVGGLGGPSDPDPWDGPDAPGRSHGNYDTRPCGLPLPRASPAVCARLGSPPACLRRFDNG